MKFWEAFMHMHDDRHPIGTVVLTPSGRRAIVKKYLSGASKRDAFDRVQCYYEDGGPRDLVTLQPHQIRPASFVQMLLDMAFPATARKRQVRRRRKQRRARKHPSIQKCAGPVQLGFEFAQLEV